MHIWLPTYLSHKFTIYPQNSIRILQVMNKLLYLLYNRGMKSQLTTLCYIEKDNSYLMLHRIYNKKDDENRDKWIGVGGHFEQGESPEDCLLREVREETGLTLHSFKFRGIVTFVSDDNPAEYMCLYTSDDFSGNLIECTEGKLEWVLKEHIEKLTLWEGDKIFLRLLAQDAPFFSLKLVYKNGKLIETALDGKIGTTT